MAWDKRNRQQRRQDEQRKNSADGKTDYERIMAGEQEPTAGQKGWKNLRPIPINTRPEEERREICRKGAEAVNRLKGEEKTAKESLDRMLSILATDEILNISDIDGALAERLKRENPNMTLYDAVNAAAIGRALAGNAKCMEYIRDTRGDSPVKQVQISENITTDADREMLRTIAERLKNAETVQIIDSIQPEDNTNKKNDPE
jgi:hypothetical protein